jgi:Domain of unknown function (DUF4262)
MLTTLDAPYDKLDEHERNFVDRIREHGWFGTHVYGDSENPSFTYTTGFHLMLNQPELIMFSTKKEITHQVFWDVYNDLKGGATLTIGKPTKEIFANLHAVVFRMAVEHYREYLGWSRWFYAGQPFPCVQIVWPDKRDVFPWEDGFDQSFVDDQIDLTKNGWVRELVK